MAPLALQKSKSEPKAKASVSAPAAGLASSSLVVSRSSTKNKNGGGHLHKLDKFGFIVNMDAQGRVIGVNNNNDNDSSDEEENNNQNNKRHHHQRYKDVPTFAEYKINKRREKKWGTMMGRWNTTITTTTNANTAMNNTNTKGGGLYRGGGGGITTTTNNNNTTIDPIRLFAAAAAATSADPKQRLPKAAALTAGAKTTKQTATVRSDTTTTTTTTTTSQQQQQQQQQESSLDLLLSAESAMMNLVLNNNNTTNFNGGGMSKQQQQQQQHVVQHRRKVITRLRKGVPDHIRGQVWKYLAKVPQRQAKYPGLYQACVQKAIQQHEEATIMAAQLKTLNAATAAATKRADNNTTTTTNNNTTASTTTTENMQSCPSPSSLTIRPSAYLAKHHKSFKNIQDTIDRDIHRTYPRHHLFYESEPSAAEEDDDDNDHEHDPQQRRGGPTTTTAVLLRQQTPLTRTSNPFPFSSSPSPQSSQGPLQTITSATATPFAAAVGANGGMAGIEKGDKEEKKTSNEHSHQNNLTPINNNNNNNPSSSPTNNRSATPTSPSSTSNFCGNEEISNMIRELEGVVVGGASSATTPTTPANESLMDQDHDNMHSLPSLLDDHPSTSSGGRPKQTTMHNHHSNASQSPRLSTGVSPMVDDYFTGGQGCLRRVLKAYSVFDRETGYCQGMNFVAGLFLAIGMTEEEAFWMLVYVMHDEPCRMRGLFGEGMRELHMVLYVAERLIQRYLPKLALHLEEEHVHITMFATQWLLTHFTSSFRFDLVTRVWDSFLGEGWKMTYRVMLAILKVHEPQLLKSSFEEILTLFRELQHTGSNSSSTLRTTSGSSIMETALKIPLQRKVILKYEQEYHLQQQQLQQQQQQQTLPRSASSMRMSTTTTTTTTAAAAASQPQPQKKNNNNNNNNGNHQWTTKTRT